MFRLIGGFSSTSAKLVKMWEREEGRERRGLRGGGGGVVLCCVVLCCVVLWSGGVCLYIAQQNSIKGAYTARTLSVRSSLQNMAGEELAHHVVAPCRALPKWGR